VGRLVAEPVAFRAGAVGAVEGEITGLELGQADLARGAEQSQGEEALPAGVVDEEDFPLRDFEGLPDGLTETPLGVGADLEGVDEGLDRVLAVRGACR
jgi:hypothetical protein